MSTRDAILEYFADRGVYADDDLLLDLTDECDGIDPASIATFLDRRGFGGDAA